MGFRRKTYGMAKPVKASKVVMPAKPKINELKAIYSRIAKSPERDHLDLICEALHWWHEALPWFRFTKTVLTLKEAVAFKAASAREAQGREEKTNQEKQKKFILALHNYRAFAERQLNIPDITPYLKKGKLVSKKSAVVDKRVGNKYDKLMTLLHQCFPSFKGDLIAVGKVPSGKTMIDHEYNKIYYDRAHCKELLDVLRKEGVLSLVLHASYVIAKTDIRHSSSSIVPTIEIRQLEMLNDFEHWARTSQYAPKSIVRRVKPKSNKPKKVKQKGVAAQLLGPMSQEEKADVDNFMAKAKIFKSLKHKQIKALEGSPT